MGRENRYGSTTQTTSPGRSGRYGVMQEPQKVATSATPSIAQKYGLPESTISQGGPMAPKPVEKQSAWNKVARAVLPKKAEDFFGMNTPQIKKDVETSYASKYAMDDTKRLQARIDPTTGKLPVRTAAETMKDRQPVDYIPFLSAIPDIKEVSALYSAVKRLEKGENTPTDDFLLMEARAKSEQDSTFGAKIAGTLAEIPAFAGELLLTGGIFSAVKKGAEKVATKGLKSQAEKTARRKYAEQFITKAIGTTAGATAQTVPARFLEITAGTIENMTPEYQYQQGEAGDFAAFVTEDGDSIVKSLAKSLGNEWAEVVSEKSGGGFTMLAAPVKNRIMKMSLFKAMLAKNPSLSPSKFMELVKSAGWNGVLEEMGEEQVGMLLRGSLNKIGLSDEEFRMPTKEELMVQAVAFSIPGAAIGLTNKAMGGGQAEGSFLNTQAQQTTQAQDTGENIPMKKTLEKTFEDIKFTKTVQEVRRDINEIFGVDPDIISTQFEENMHAEGAVGQVDLDGTIRLLSENNKVSDVVAKHEVVHWIKRNASSPELLEEISQAETHLMEMFPEKVREIEEAYKGTKANVGEELLSNELARYYETGKTFSEKAKTLFNKIIQKLEYLFNGKKDLLKFFDNIKSKTVSREEAVKNPFLNNQIVSKIPTSPVSNDAAPTPQGLFPGVAKTENQANPVQMSEEEQSSLFATETQGDSAMAEATTMHEEIVQGLPPDIGSTIEPLEEVIKGDVRTPLGQKIGILDYLRTPWRVFDKMGIQPAYQKLLAGYEAYMKELPKNIDKITAWSKRVSEESNERIFDSLDGEQVDLNAEEAQVASEIKEWTSEWADRLGMDKDSRITDYITHIFPAGKGGEIPEEIAFMINNKIPGSVYNPFLLKRLGAEGYLKDTWRALDAYAKRATRKVHMDPGLKEVKKAADQLTDTSQIDYINSYVGKINLRPSKFDTTIDNFIKQNFGFVFGVRPTAAISRTLRMMIARAKIGFSAVSFAKNLTQGVNTFAELGSFYTTVGYKDLVQFGGKELKEEGVLIDSFIEDRKYSAIKSVMEKVDNVMFLNMTASEFVNRGAAYYGAKSKFISGKIKPKEYRMAFGKEMPKDYVPTLEDAIKYGKFIAGKTQFQFGSLDTPVAMNSDLMKLTLQFQTFGLKQAEFIVQMGKDKEYKKLVRYTAASMMLFQLIGKAFGMAWDDSFKILRFGPPPAIKFFIDLFNQLIVGEDKYGNKLNAEEKVKEATRSIFTNVVPGGAQMDRTRQGLTAVNEGKVTTKSGSFKHDVAQTPDNYVRGGLFGKYNLPESQQYFKDEDQKKKDAAKKRAGKSTSGSSRAGRY